MAGLAVCKAAAALLFLLTALIGASVPFALNKCHQRKRASRLLLLNAFAGGAFLALGLLHIMPEAIKLLDEMEVEIHLNGKSYGVAFLLIFAGYLIILFCEGVLCGELSMSAFPLGRGPSGLTEDRRDAKGSCTTKSSHSGDDLEGPIYAAAAAIEAGGTVELSGVSPGDAGDRDRVAHRRESSCSGGGGVKEVLYKGFDSAAFFMMVALAIHGLFEGAIVGAAREMSMMWVMTAVVVGHKWAEAMLLMCQLIERKLTRVSAGLLTASFALSSPLGVLVGSLLAAEGRLVSGVCNALGAGTVLYIASEISGSAFQGCRKGRWLQFFAYCCGATLVLGLTLLDVAYGQ